MTDLPLDPPKMPQPVASVHRHGKHWDAVKYITKDGGWTWLQVSGVNWDTEEKAREWAGL